MALLSRGGAPSCSKYETHFNPPNDVAKDGDYMNGTRLPRMNLTSNVLDLFPCGLSEAEGTLSAGDERYRVKVNLERGKRVWARVIICQGIEDDGRRREAFYEVARKGIESSEWAPLCVDPRDGETLYSATFNCDLSSEALDRFLGAARDFLECNHEELEQFLGGPNDGFNDAMKLDKLLDIFDIDDL